jgi:hypothetical protein
MIFKPIHSDMKSKTRLMKAAILGCSLFVFSLGCKKYASVTDPAETSVTESSRSNSLAGPPPPSNIRLDPTYAQTPFTVRLTWDAPAWTDVLIYRGTSSTIEAVASYDANLNPHYWYTLNNLQQNTSYTFRFQSQINGSERGPIGEPFTFTTQPTNDHRPPTDPSNLVITCDPYTIYLNWNGSTDNYDPVSEITYEIYNAGTGQLVREFKGHNFLHFPNGGVIFAPGQKYLVKARDRSGNRSGASNAALVQLQCRV